MQMNGNIETVGNVRIRRSCDTVVGVWKRRMWPSDGRGASICRCPSYGVETMFVRCNKEVDYQKALVQLVAATQELTVSKIFSRLQVLLGKLGLYDVLE